MSFASAETDRPAGAAGPVDRATRRALLHPATAFGACVGLGAGAFALAPTTWMVQGILPSVSGDPVTARLAFVAACAAVIVASVRWPERAAAVHAVIGAMWVTSISVSRFSLAMLVLSFVVFHGAPRVRPHIAMLAAAALAMVARLYTLDAPSMSAESYAATMASARLAYYAFQARSIRRSQRALAPMLAYAPFSVLLWPGDPALLSYLTQHTDRPRAQLTAAGVRQLYRGGAKLLALSLLLNATFVLLSDPRDFTGLPFPTQTTLAIAFALAFYLRLSGVADVGCGLSNLAGRWSPDAFDAPFRAYSPFDLWRRWNIHVLGFVREVFIFPVLKRRRSTLLMILAGSVGYISYHWYMISGWTAYTLSPTDRLMAELHEYVPMMLLLVITAPLEGHYRHLKWGWRALIIGVYQVVLVGSLFGAITLVYLDRVPVHYRAARCLLRQMFDRDHSCEVGGETRPTTESHRP